MISHKYKCIFVHIPKTAGQSIEHFFLKLHGLTWEKRAPLLLRYNPDPKKGPESLAHLTAEEYVKYGYVTQKQFDEYFKFAFVRNPWDRLLSEYHYRNYHKHYTFTEFVTHGLPQADNYSDRYRHIMPQSDFIYDDNDKLIVDFVGRFENLQKDFRLILKKLNLPPSDLPHVNKSKGKRFFCFTKIFNFITPKRRREKYYYKEPIDLINLLYSRDIQNFGYKFNKQIIK